VPFFGRKGFSNHGEVYPKEVEKSTVTDIGQRACYGKDAGAGKGM